MTTEEMMERVLDRKSNVRLIARDIVDRAGQDNEASAYELVDYLINYTRDIHQLFKRG